MDLDTRLMWGPSVNSLHAQILAARDLPPHPAAAPARYTSRPIVSVNGELRADFIDTQGVEHHDSYVGDLANLVQYVDHITKELQLTDAQNLELRQSVDNWISTSFEATRTYLAPPIH
jgi:hypothetical protein